MNLTAGVAAKLLPDYQHLAGVQVGRQIGVVLFEAGDGCVVGLGDAAEGLTGLDLMKRRGLRSSLGAGLRRFRRLPVLSRLGRRRIVACRCYFRARTSCQW